MRGTLLAVMLGLAAPACAASEFLEALHRAQARSESDPELVEYATRAIRAWRPGDGRLMLAAAHLRRAEGLLARREPRPAVEDLVKVEENDPRNARALLLRAGARLSLGRWLDAEKDYVSYTDQKPDDEEGFIGLAKARLPAAGSARPAEARKAAARARRLAPSDWRPDWLDGVSYRLERRPEAALGPLDRSVEAAKGGHPEPLAERARALTELGRHPDAEADWGKVIPLYERGLEEADRARLGEAAVKEERGRLGDAHFSRGLLREFMLNAEGARADFAAACELGHAEACAKARTAPRAKTAKVKRPKPAASELDPPEPVRPKPPKRKKVRNPKNDSGERIYAN